MFYGHDIIIIIDHHIFCHIMLFYCLYWMFYIENIWEMDQNHHYHSLAITYPFSSTHSIRNGHTSSCSIQLFRFCIYNHEFFRIQPLSLHSIKVRLTLRWTTTNSASTKILNAASNSSLYEPILTVSTNIIPHIMHRHILTTNMISDGMITSKIFIIGSRSRVIIEPVNIHHIQNHHDKHHWWCNVVHLSFFHTASSCLFCLFYGFDACSVFVVYVSWIHQVQNFTMIILSHWTLYK